LPNTASLTSTLTYLLTSQHRIDKNLEMIKFDASAEYVVIHTDKMWQVRANKHTCWVTSMQRRYTQVWILQCI